MLQVLQVSTPFVLLPRDVEAQRNIILRMLPQSHTCDNTLELPDYAKFLEDDSKMELEKVGQTRISVENLDCNTILDRAYEPLLFLFFFLFSLIYSQTQILHSRLDRAIDEGLAAGYSLDELDNEEGNQNFLESRYMDITGDDDDDDDDD